MNIGIEFITGNVGMGLVNIFLLLIVIGNLIFWAIKFELGNLILLFVSSAFFILTYANGYLYWPAAVVMMISIVLMAFSLIMSQKTQGVYIT